MPTHRFLAHAAEVITINCPRDHRPPGAAPKEWRSYEYDIVYFLYLITCPFVSCQVWTCSSYCRNWVKRVNEISVPALEFQNFTGTAENPRLKSTPNTQGPEYLCMPNMKRHVLLGKDCSCFMCLRNDLPKWQRWSGIKMHDFQLGTLEGLTSDV